MSNVLTQILAGRSELPLQSARDYRQYRIRVGRQLLRTRKSLGIQTKPSRGKGNSAVEKSTEPRHRVAFVSPTVTEVESNPELLKVLVCLAERSWATAMETNSVLDTNFTQSKKSHVRSKLAKACKYIDTATLISHQIAASSESESFSPLQQLQLETYSLLLHGALSFQKRNYSQCTKDYSLARVALESFSGTVNESSVKDTIQELISTVIDPSLVYAHYRLHKVRPLSAASLAVKVARSSWDSPVIDYIKKVDPAALDASLAEVSASNRLDVVKWRSHEANIEDKELAATLYRSVSKDDDLEKSISSSNDTQSIDASMSLFDDVLQAWQDAHDMVRNNIDRLESSGTASHDKQVQDQYVVATYAGYHMLLRRIQRDSLLLKRAQSRVLEKPNGSASKSSLEKYQEVIRLFDTILQSTNQLLNLSGVHSDKSLSDSLAALDAYYTSKRLSVLASAYKLADQIPEAFALYNKANKILEAAPQTIEATFPPKVLDQTKYSKAIANARTNALQLRAQLTIRKAPNSQSDDAMDLDDGQLEQKSISSVVDSLDQYALASFSSAQELSKNLISLEAQPKIPFAKPVFFDIAYNFIEAQQQGIPVSSSSSSSSSNIPVVEKAVESAGEAAESTTAEEKKKGGFFRIWGR